MNDSTQQPTDKRVTKRVTPTPDQPVHIDLKGPDFVETTTAINVSREGIGISIPHGFNDRNLDEINTIFVKLPEPVNHSFSAAIKVIHHEGNNFGVEFKTMEKEDEKILCDYIEHQLMNTTGIDLLKMLYGG